MAQLLAKDKRMGMPPEDYAKQLIEDGLALQREAEQSTFAEIMAPVRRTTGTVDEFEIVTLIEKVRTSHHRRSTRGKKR